MNGLDAVVLGILGVSAFNGWRKGLLGAFFGLLAVAAGYFVSPFLAPYVVPLMGAAVPKALVLPAARALAWAVLFIGLSLISMVVVKWVRQSPLGIVDRIGGVALGLAVPLAVVIGLLVVVEALPPIKKQMPPSAVVTALSPVTKPIATSLAKSMGQWFPPQLPRDWSLPADAMLKELPSHPTPPKPQASSKPRGR